MPSGRWTETFPQNMNAAVMRAKGFPDLKRSLLLEKDTPLGTRLHRSVKFSAFLGMFLGDWFWFTCFP